MATVTGSQPEIEAEARFRNAQRVEATPKTAGQHAIERLEKATATYRERNAQYNDSFSRWGPIFEALFPYGVDVRTPDDWNRLTTLGHIVDKLTRYTTDFHHPHEDSIHDLGVYAFILQGIDAEVRHRDDPPGHAPTNSAAKMPVDRTERGGA